MTIIKYTKERLNGSLKMGKFFSVLGVFFLLLSFVYDNWNGISPMAIGVGEIGGGILMLFVYSYQKRNQYLSIENDELTKYGLFKKKIMLSDVVSIKEFAGDIKLIMKKGEFIIDTQIIEPESLVELKNKLGMEKLKQSK